VKSSFGTSGHSKITASEIASIEKLILKRNFSPKVEAFVENLTGEQWARCSLFLRSRIVEICFYYWRHSGFPYFQLSDGQISDEYGRLERTKTSSILADGEIRISTVGLSLANMFHPHMWEVPVKSAYTPYDRFFDDKALRRLIAHALKIWPQRRSVNSINLRGMLRTFSKTTRVSNFRPTAAKAIFEHFSKEHEIVLDFSAGYGGRLLGCLPLKRTYIGIDPCKSQVKGLEKMTRKLANGVDTLAKVKIIMGCAEDVMPNIKSNSIDLIFSSPPYFDLERYSRERTQSYLRYPKYEEWRIRFFRSVIFESHRILRPGGKLIINLPDANVFPLVEDLNFFAKGLFKQKKILKLMLGHKPYLRALTGSTHKFEPIFVLSKQSN
jgi:DNA modification methylase